MTKKKKKRTIYSIGQKKFDTFKAMKAYVWHNSHTDEEIQGFEIIDDEIQKHYIFIKKERRLLCIKIYDAIEKYKKWIEKQQLELFTNEIDQRTN